MSETKRSKHIMIAWMEDKPGVLNRVAGLFSRRNFNIESLVVGNSETAGISRMTFVANGEDRDMRQIETQLDKLINVTRVEDVTYRDPIMRELALIRVQANKENRAEVMQLVSIFRAQVVDVTLESLIIQIVGKESQVDSFIELLTHFGILEMVRTGRVAMVRGEKQGQTAVAIPAPLSQSNGRL